MSREFKLLESMTDIDEKFIEEADAEIGVETVTVRPGRKRWIAIAACICLLVVAIIPIINNIAPMGSVKQKDFTDEAQVYKLESKDEAVEESANGLFEAYKGYTTGSNTSTLTANVDSYDFDSDRPWVKVIWNNPTDEDLKISPEFIIVRIGDYDKIESTIYGSTKIVFETVLYNVPAGGTYTITYNIDRGVYDISKPGHYRIYFDTAEVPEEIPEGRCFDFQLD